MAHETKNMVESIRVRVPSNSKSPLHRNCGDCSAEFVLQNHDNFRRSGPPFRFLYFTCNGSWRDFSGEILGPVRSAFLEAKPMVDVWIADSRYLFDLTRMVQIDFDSGNRRSIAWIDDSGKCFFPKMFIDEDFDDAVEDNHNPKIEIKIRIDNNSNNCVKRKREDTEEEEVSSSRRQGEEEEQKRQRLIQETSRWTNARVLREDEKPYLTVRDQFLLGMKKVDPNVVITAIHQCSRAGPLEKARREVFDKQVEIIKAPRGVSNVVYAWYGASANGLESASAHGFRVDSKASGAECYGVGVYLSPLGLPHVSANLAKADKNGERHVVLCRVILGNVEKVNVGSQQYYSSGVDFDTGSDDPKNPKWYIVGLDSISSRIMPEFVVSFKCYNPPQGQMSGLGCTKYPIEKLFSKMKGLLPPVKIREVVSLYEGYRSGKMIKDVFIKQLRWTVGDKVLLSAIKEIRGSE